MLQRGVIRGTISNPTDALAPGAEITIDEVRSGAALYSAPNVLVGTYKLSSKRWGFQRLSKP